MSGIYTKKGKELKIRFIVSMTEKDRRQKIISRYNWKMIVYQYKVDCVTIKKKL